MLQKEVLANKRRLHNQKRKNQSNERKKLTRAQEARRAKQELNDNLKYEPLKIIFEILTNIHNNCSKVLWNFIKEQDGIRLIFKQYGIGTSIQEVINGMATSEKIKDETHFNNKEDKAGGLFGSGLSLIEYYTLELYFRTNGFSYDIKTDDIIPYQIGDEVEIEMLIPIASHKVKYIQSAKNLIEKTEFFIKSNSRTHNFIIDGFTSTENTFLSKLIEKESLVWKTATGVKKDDCDFSTININGKVESETIIPVTISRGKRGEETYNVRLYNFKIGKLYDVPTSWKIVDTNKPFLILISKETNQILGIIPWSGSHPVSTNNSCIIAYVSKTDLRWLFNSADKMDGFHPIAESKFIDWMKSTLNKLYPDSSVLEAGGQFWARDIIVYDKIGKKSSNTFREENGLAWMNDLSVSIREKICKSEWSSGKGRFDLHIWLAKDGKINSSTQKIIIECKRKGFNTDDFNQLYSYIGQTTKCVGGIGLSIDIKPNHRTNFDIYSTSIQGSGQMSNDISFYLTDLLDYGFNNFVDEYTKIDMAEEKLAKEKQKLEESKK